ncbi:hypothetical protein BGX26_006222, partial [Mortierella sp. AD094]
RVFAGVKICCSTLMILVNQLEDKLSEAYFVWSILFGNDRKVTIDTGDSASKATKADIHEAEIHSTTFRNQEAERPTHWCEL